jgi:hypothetical protein
MMVALHEYPLDGDRAPACRRLQVFVQQWEREPTEDDVSQLPQFPIAL